MKDSVMLRIFLLVISVVLFTVGCECEKESGLPVDGDGNVYDTVVIGNQVWLKQNLKTTRYRDGTPIPLVTDNDKWASMTTGAYCWYNNNPVYKENYGALYNWYAAGYACPVGWHVPTKEEWETLFKNLGWDLIDRKTGYELEIKNHELSLENLTGETAPFKFPLGGYRLWDGTFHDIGYVGYYWISEGSFIKYFNHYTFAYINRIGVPSGFSVKCVRDK